ncbi:MAG: hypothetical protein ABIF19_18065 [Planctomycetota bacterium]
MSNKDGFASVQVATTGTRFLSGAEVAELFWDLDDTEQARFFNELGGKKALCFQLQEVTDNPELASLGRWAMRLIGDYQSAVADEQAMGEKA